MTINSQRKQDTRIILLLIFLLFPFIQQRSYADLPAYLYHFATALYKYYSLFAATVIYYLWISNKKLVRKQNSYIIWMAIFWSIYLISTFINSLDLLTTVIRQAYTQFALVILVTIACRKWAKEFLTAASVVYGGWIFLTLLTSFLYPEGLYRTATYHTAHLLGDDNALIYVMLPGLTIMSVKSMLDKGNVNILVWSLIILTTTLYTYLWAASAMIAMFLFIVLLLLISLKIPIKTMLLLYTIIATMAICLFGLTNDYAAIIMEDYLEKDITLSGRTILWAQAILMILQSPIIGYGGFFINGSFTIEGNNEYPCHTPYLQILIDGGFLLFIAYWILVFKAFHYTKKYKKNKAGTILICGLFCMMMNFITEHSAFLHFFIIMTMIYNIDYIAIQYNKKEWLQCKK